MQLLQKELKTINTRNAGSKKRKYIRKEKKKGRGVVVGFLPTTIPHLDSKKLQKGWMGCCGWGKKGGGSYPLALKKCFQFYAVYCCWDIDKSNEKFFDEKGWAFNFLANHHFFRVQNNNYLFLGEGYPRRFVVLFLNMYFCEKIPKMEAISKQYCSFFFVIAFLF